MLERALIAPAARAALIGHAKSRTDTETGGILIGRRLAPDTVLISRVSPPGPRARHGRFFFSRDVAFLQSYLDEHYDRSGGSDDYVGEWHVHLAFDTPPSCVDRRSLYRIARQPNYATDNPLLIIAEHEPPELRLRAYGFQVKPKRRTSSLPLRTATPTRATQLN